MSDFLNTAVTYGDVLLAVGGLIVGSLAYDIEQAIRRWYRIRRIQREEEALMQRRIEESGYFCTRTNLN